IDRLAKRFARYVCWQVHSAIIAPRSRGQNDALRIGESVTHGHTSPSEEGMKQSGAANGSRACGGNENGVSFLRAFLLLMFDLRELGDKLLVGDSGDDHSRWGVVRCATPRAGPESLQETEAFHPLPALAGTCGRRGRLGSLPERARSRLDNCGNCP